MPKVDVYNLEGKVVGSIELADSVFAVEPHHDLVHRVVKMQLANRRQGTAKVKGRSEVRGGGRKPWRQKGTGRARHGSTRAAQWVGGGIIFGPTPRDYSYSMPKKMRRRALLSVLSNKLATDKLIIVDDMTLKAPKTKLFVQAMKNINVNGSALLFDSEPNEPFRRSANNVPQVKFTPVNTINVLDLLKFEYCVLSRAAAEQLQEVYTK
ncbi:MAG: 50S ribosomal protein L4 [Clostridiaceae bacterium]|nr:50S ribosomal protein L4 [Clostridiaceae bacterium]